MRDDKKKNQTAAERRLPELWQHMHRQGAEFFVDGEIVRPQDAVSRAVREDCVYMTDYVWGEKGEIRQVRLDKVYID